MILMIITHSSLGWAVICRVREATRNAPHSGHECFAPGLGITTNTAVVCCAPLHTPYKKLSRILFRYLSEVLK